MFKQIYNIESDYNDCYRDDDKEKQHQPCENIIGDIDELIFPDDYEYRISER